MSQNKRETGRMEQFQDRKNMTRLKTISQGITEEVKIQVERVLQEFEATGNLHEFTFPCHYSNKERAYVHQKAGERGYSSKSDGKEPRRQVTIRKHTGNQRIVVHPITLNDESLEKLQRVRAAVLQGGPTDNTGSVRQESQTDEVARGGFTNRLFTTPPPRVPKPSRTPRHLSQFRMQLPIWQKRNEVIRAINTSNIVFIKGDTGCGKTTQVPQFILDDAVKRQEKVRVVCTVPRRIAAVSISDRVASERGERIGHTVGYQIRLESCISPIHTVLTFCTSGILLRSLTSFDYSILQKTTHIIIDEVHERDRQTEFLLACLKDVCQQFPKLKIILMGADMNTSILTKYFGGGSQNQCPLIEVHGRIFPVHILHLEDILGLLDYDGRNRSTNLKCVNNRFDNLLNELKHRTRGTGRPEDNFNSTLQGFDTKFARTQEEEICKTIQEEVNEKIRRIWTNGDMDALKNILDLVRNGRISANYRHTHNGVSILAACAIRGCTQFVEDLLAMGADPTMPVCLDGGKSFALQDLVQDFGIQNQQDVLRIFAEHGLNKLLIASPAQSLPEGKQELLEIYQKNVNDDRVDLSLIVKLLYWLHMKTDPEQAVLVFLPGYDDIVTLKQMIFVDADLGHMSHDFVVFLLHSNIQTGDQRAVFVKPRRGLRKIILSTNVAETSLTIEDVVFVIDSGKVKEKTYDSTMGVTQLRSNWISKASANQRQGRAGRCQTGTCFRLYSSARFSNMNAFPVPEIVRSSLHELCLYTRAFIRKELRIQDFFTKLPEPPAPIAVKKSVDALQAMGALDAHEQLTQLGMYLLDLPVEPHLGKALIYSVVLKCLDPILTIVSLASHREPFQLPANPDDKRNALIKKAMFADGSLSDHLAALKAFQDWEKSTLFSEAVQRKYCSENFVSGATFEMAYGIRSQLLGQLRASGFAANAGVSELKELNTNSHNCALVKGVLTAALYPNICCVDRKNNCLFNEYDAKIKFHPTSIVPLTLTDGGRPQIAKIPENSDWIIYDEISQQEHCRTLRGCTAISEVHLALFGGSFTNMPEFYECGSTALDEANLLYQVREKRFNLNSWIGFRGDEDIINGILYLRQQLNDLILRRLQSPTQQSTEFDSLLVATIASVLKEEDLSRDFKSIEGIGQWPKLVSGNLMSAPSAGFGRSLAVVEDQVE